MVDKPQVNIFAICDRIVRDQHGKASLLGIFDTFNFPAFPATFPFVLFTQIVAPRGIYRVTVRFGPTDDLSQPVLEESIEVKADPGAAILAANLSLPFERPGPYEFHLYIGDVPMLTRPFQVRQVS